MGGVNFQSAGDTLLVIDPAYDSHNYDFGNGLPVLMDNWGGGTGITMTFASPTPAVGGLWSDGYGSPTSMTFTFNLAGGGTASRTESLNGYPNLDFYGFLSSVPIVSMSVETDYGAPVVASLSTPEPATLCSLLSGAGMASAIGVRRWRRKVA